MTPNTRGFTLVEILISLALALILILIAVVTFRTATQTMTRLEQLANENRLIRSGYLIAMDDVDFWHSHANPAFPYLKGYNAMTEEGASVADAGNDFFDKKIFRPVEWPKSLDDPANPNWAQPHDPRTWYRGGVVANQESGVIAPANEAKVNDLANATFFYDPLFYEEGGDPENRKEQTDSRLHKDVAGPGARLTRPAGWSHRHISGDYAALSNIDNLYLDYSVTDNPTTTTVDERLSTYSRTPGSIDYGRSWRQQQVRSVFGELGIHGALAYLHPGSPAMMFTSSVNDTVANIGDQTKNYRKGELPWALFMGPEVMGINKVDPTVYDDAFATAYPDFNRLNLFLARPDRHNIMFNPVLAGSRFPVFMDFNSVVGDTILAPVAEFNRFNYLQTGSVFPSALVYPPAPQLLDPGTGEVSWSDHEFLNGRPVLAMDVPGIDDQIYNRYVGGNFFGKPNSERWFRDNRSLTTATTYHLPRNATDDPQPSLALDETVRQSLAVGLHRFRHGGNEKSDITITLSTAVEGDPISLRFRSMGTGWRGARQHWGRRSGTAGVPNGMGANIKLGDRYVTP
jgi:prepilin-type N-terminal cleavage/methylation domain-containing protein